MNRSVMKVQYVQYVRDSVKKTLFIHLTTEKSGLVAS